MRLVWVAAVVLATTGWSLGQDQSNNLDELNRKYTDALTQLKAAQDRKNELATVNQTLTARITDLEKQLEESKRQAATFSEQTFRLRSHYAAWQVFVRRYPLLLEKWKSFVESDPLSQPSALPALVDPTVSLRAE